MNGFRLAISSIFLLPFAATAHHSVAANFDEKTITELEGEIVRVFWRNPHVGFTVSVRDEDGGEELWDIESTSVSTLRRMDISQSLVSAGQTVRVAGNPSRRGDRLIYVNNLLLPDGREAVFGDAIKQLANFKEWHGVQNEEIDSQLTAAAIGTAQFVTTLGESMSIKQANNILDGAKFDIRNTKNNVLNEP